MNISTNASTMNISSTRGNCSLPNHGAGIDFRINTKQSCSTSVPVIFLLVGVIQSVISLSVLAQRSLRQLPLRSSLIILCVAALVLLMLGMPRLAIMCYFYIDIRKLSPALCIIHRALTDTMLQLTTTIIAFISLERFIALLFPYRIPQRRMKVERVSLSIITIFCCLCNAHYFATMNTKTYRQHCHIKKFYDKWIILLMSCVQTYIPFLVILTSNVCFIKRLCALRKRRNKRRRLYQNEINMSETQERKIRLMLLDTAHGHGGKATNELNNTNTLITMTTRFSTESHQSRSLDANGHPNCSMTLHQDYASNRENKAATLILFITISFVLFNIPYECYTLLLKHRVIPQTLLTVDIWLILVYITYCYQLLVFPVYIFYHPIIQKQLKAWFVNDGQGISRDELPTFENQNTDKDS